MKKIDFYRHNIDEDDIAKATEVLRSLFLTTGEWVEEFEKNIAGYTGSRYAVGMNSCTSALHMSLLAWGVGEGDEVITTPMSFVATANAIVHACATPVFVDVERDTGNINTELIESAITDKTKAIIPVHLYGQMCDMKSIRDIANRHKLVIIEDAAHCIEGSRDGYQPGQAGDAACFSFYATKNITSGEGGAIVTDDNEKAETLKSLRLHGMNSTAADRYNKLYRHYDIPMVGWKCNMNNIQAALLIGQLERIDSLLAQREAAYKKYEESFASDDRITIPATLGGGVHARHLFTIQVDPLNRDQVMTNLQDQGIGIAVNFRAIHLMSYYQSVFGYKEGDFPEAERIGASTISIPFYPSISDEDIDTAVEAVLKALP